jgi:hypothetical protein
MLVAQQDEATRLKQQQAEAEAAECERARVAAKEQLRRQRAAAAAAANRVTASSTEAADSNEPHLLEFTPATGALSTPEYRALDATVSSAASPVRNPVAATTFSGTRLRRHASNDAQQAKQQSSSSALGALVETGSSSVAVAVSPPQPPHLREQQFQLLLHVPSSNRFGGNSRAPSASPTRPASAAVLPVPSVPSTSSAAAGAANATTTTTTAATASAAPFSLQRSDSGQSRADFFCSNSNQQQQQIATATTIPIAIPQKPLELRHFTKADVLQLAHERLRLVRPDVGLRAVNPMLDTVAVKMESAEDVRREAMRRVEREAAPAWLEALRTTTQPLSVATVHIMSRPPPILLKRHRRVDSAGRRREREQQARLAASGVKQGGGVSP